MSTQPHYTIDNEVAPLTSVVVHRPGDELLRLTPGNAQSLLFDGIPWLEQAQNEHDNFTNLLEANEVEVLTLTRLLTETLDDSAAYTQFITMICNASQLGADSRQLFLSLLSGLSPQQLIEIALSGITRQELAQLKMPRHALSFALMNTGNFVIPPLPNALFTRDASIRLGKQVTISQLFYPARRRETEIYRFINSHYPRFRLNMQTHQPSQCFLEGGDVIAAAPGVVLVGVGERTTPAGVESFAKILSENPWAKLMIAVPIPAERSSIHLDTLLTFVDEYSIVGSYAVLSQLYGYSISLDPSPLPTFLKAQNPQPFLPLLTEALQVGYAHLDQTGKGFENVKSSTPADRGQSFEREQWDEGNNTLCIAPRKVITYQRNSASNAALGKAGVEVLELAASELVYGRGGPRCMSCPVSRSSGI